MINQEHLTEDTVSQSGWVFADLLVALSVVFLATISFIPSIQSGSSPSPIEPGKLVKPEGFSEIYEKTSVAQLLADIDEFRLEQTISSRTPLIHLQILGSSEEKDGRAGILDALEFSIAIQNENLDAFKDVSISIETSDRLEPGQVLIRGVFGKASTK